MPPEEEAFASKACGNKYKYCKKIVCRCPKQQKTTQRDQYKTEMKTKMKTEMKTKMKMKMNTIIFKQGIFQRTHMR